MGLKVGIKFFYFVDLFNLWSRFEILDKLNIFRSSLIKCIIVLIININNNYLEIMYCWK